MLGRGGTMRVVLYSSVVGNQTQRSALVSGPRLLLGVATVGATNQQEIVMGFGRGVLLWLLGVPIPIILLLALFWHH
jgi:hypothetical protein